MASSLYLRLGLALVTLSDLQRQSSIVTIKSSDGTSVRVHAIDKEKGELITKITKTETLRYPIRTAQLDVVPQQAGG